MGNQKRIKSAFEGFLYFFGLLLYFVVLCIPMLAGAVAVSTSEDKALDQIHSLEASLLEAEHPEGYISYEDTLSEGVELNSNTYWVNADGVLVSGAKVNGEQFARKATEQEVEDYVEYLIQTEEVEIEKGWFDKNRVLVFIISSVISTVWIGVLLPKDLK